MLRFAFSNASLTFEATSEWSPNDSLPYDVVVLDRGERGDLDCGEPCFLVLDADDRAVDRSDDTGGLDTNETEHSID